MPVRAPDFPDALDWLNTGGVALSLRALRGRAVLLDFWTYGCINCLHVIPQLHELERRFGDRLQVIGVHSGKFIEERRTASLREAVVRLGVGHPVVNDRQFRTWRAYAVRAWPTLVLVDPRGYVVHQHAGEIEADAMAVHVEDALRAEAERAADSDSSGIAAPGVVSEEPAVAPGPLRYPGKVVVDGDRVAVADTGNHRVLVGRLDADGTPRLTRAFGRVPGFADGVGEDARLRAPQGLAFDGDLLHLADTGNHAVRTIDLRDGSVRTIAGTGRRVRTRAELAAGAIASPWDLALHEGTLYVAMAGMHQLHALDPRTGVLRPHAGTMGEELVDGPLREALLAQPMAIAAGGGALWFADAESSAIRRADVEPNGAVETIVGTGLFDFGDRDGAGDTVRLQHPQGIARAPDGRLLVADTYNGALKWVDPATREARTWIRGLREPNGVALLPDGSALVAETNAHRVVKVEDAD